MNARRVLLSLVAGALIAVAAPLHGDMTISTLANARTTTGVTGAIHAVVSAPGTPDRWSFQTHLVGYATVRLESSLDGAAWAPVRPFIAPDEIDTEQECGSCWWRFNIVTLPPGAMVSIWVVQSGALVPAVIP